MLRRLPNILSLVGYRNPLILFNNFAVPLSRLNKTLTAAKAL